MGRSRTGPGELGDDHRGIELSGRTGVGRIRIGISGWTYPPWRGDFYPKGLPHRSELSYAAERLTSIEINGTFYSLQRPSSFATWRAATPEGFVFAAKGGRFITHMKRLLEPELSLANYFAAGILGLGPKLGPLLWQLPPNLPYERDRLTQFFQALPRTTTAAAILAERHDERLKHGAVTTAEADRRIRHAVEVRHPSYRTAEFIELLRRHRIGLVVADTAGRWPHLEDVTADFVYVRLHGAEELYASGYTDAALDDWAAKIRSWAVGGSPDSEFRLTEPAAEAARGRDVFVYFDNDVKGYAPYDAMRLIERVGR
jgi:uncharacterized protein YecE (DUF72 family)